MFNRYGFRDHSRRCSLFLMHALFLLNFGVLNHSESSFFYFTLNTFKLHFKNYSVPSAYLSPLCYTTFKLHLRVLHIL